MNLNKKLHTEEIKKVMELEKQLELNKSQGK